jgi:hypothetical protein
VNSTNELQYSGQIFTMEIAGKPTIAFEAANLTEARELYKEQWLKEARGRRRANGAPRSTMGQPARSAAPTTRKRPSIELKCRPAELPAT